VVQVTFDQINGLFEFCGSVALWVNVRQLYLDKKIRGVHWLPTAFFMSWGFWNLIYYPSLNQWWSLYGGLSIVVANTVWLGQMIWYGRKGR
jgi:hypothetical protein